MPSPRTHQINRPVRRNPLRWPATLLVATTLVASACGHTSSGSAPKSTETGGATTTAGAVPSGAPGVFGSLGKICGPASDKSAGSANGGVKVRGVTDTDIHIGVLNDAGNTLSPGLGAAYPRVAKAFATWCNAAGGINGRKIVIEDRDAKLFNAAAVVTDACQSDFMLVGGGAALDEPTIAPREKCGLGSIPAINASYPDQTSKLQAVVGRASPTESNWGLFRVLQPEHASAFDKIGIVALDTPTVRGPYESFAKVLESKGMKVTSFQAISQNLDNVRTYIQPLVGKSDALVLAFTAPAIFQAMADVGYTPSLVVDPGSAFYNNAAVDALKKTPIKAPIYTSAMTYPLDRAAGNPTAAKLVALEKANFGRVDPADTVPWITWLLFAQSASACTNLTVECVIDHATSEKAYTAGGLLGPTDMTDPAKVNRCFAVSTVSADGIIYDKKVTDPDTGVFNCNPANVTKIP